MTLDFARAIREATALTRAGKLRRATDAIQMALTKGRHANDGESDEADSASVPQIVGPSPAASPQGEHQSLSRRSYRPTMPLASVVEILRRGNRQGWAGASQVLRRLSAPEVPAGAVFSTCAYAGPAGRLNYKVYLPRNRRVDELPLIVMLHGCNQDPDDFALGTRMNALAEEHGFLVAYPEQPPSANPSSCWNWFDPNHQRRGVGEPAIIAGITEQITREFGVDRNRVFIAGLSAGAAMASVMVNTYPEVYSAVGIHSGVPYRSATDVVSAFAAMRGDSPLGSAGGPIARPHTNAIIFHGDADKTVHPSNSERIVKSLVGSARGETKTGSRGGRRYVQTLVPNGPQSRVEHWVISGGGHAWSGGSNDGSFADAGGPDASREMVRFFLDVSPGNLAAKS